MKIQSRSTVSFHTLKVSSETVEHDLYAVVRWDTDESVKVPVLVVSIIKSLRDGKTVAEAAKANKVTIEYVIELLDELQQVSFLKEVDGVALPDTVEKIHPWIPHANRRWFTWFVSKPFLFGALFFSLSGVIIGLFTKGYFPTYKDFFWTPDIFLVFVSITVLDFILLFFHELGHFITTKAVGGQAIMRISRRLFYIVAETESYHVATIPKVFRYLIYLSGMLVDFTFIGICYWILLYADATGLTLGIWRNLLFIIILMEIRSIIWQYGTYLQTDMYNFLTDFFDYDFLLEDTKVYLKRLLQKIFRSVKPGQLQQTNKQSRRQAQIYAFFLISGILFEVIQFIFIILPKDYVFFMNGLADLIKATWTGNGIDAVKNGIVLLLVCYQYFALAFLRSPSRPE